MDISFIRLFFTFLVIDCLFCSILGQNNVVKQMKVNPSQPESQPSPQYNPYPNYPPISSYGIPRSDGMKYEQQIPYSYVVKPVVMSVPEITSFDFQTEDYKDQMEVEMQWINDRDRLDDDIPSVYESVIAYEPIKEEEYYKSQTKDDSDMTGDTKDSSDKSLQILPIMPANQEVVDEDKFEDKTVTPETEVTPDLVTPKVSHQLPSPRRAKNPRQRQRTGGGRRRRRKPAKEAKTQENGQWQTVVGPDGTQVLQRVLTLPSQTIELPNGYHAVGKKEIITEEEEVVTEKLRPIVREEVVEMPSRKVN